MAKKTLQDRARAAASTYISFTRKGGLNMWLKGHAAGVRDAQKDSAALRRRLLDSIKKANLQHECARKAEHEANIARFKASRESIALRKAEHDLRLRAAAEEDKRRAILQSRLPPNNGGYYR